MDLLSSMKDRAQQNEEGPYQHEQRRQSMDEDDTSRKSLMEKTAHVEGKYEGVDLSLEPIMEGGVKCTIKMRYNTTEERDCFLTRGGEGGKYHHNRGIQLCQRDYSTPTV